MAVLLLVGVVGVVLSALHPQLEDLLEINWDDRWNSLSLPPQDGLSAAGAAQGEVRETGARLPYRYDMWFQTSAEQAAAAAGVQLAEEEAGRSRRRRVAVASVFVAGGDSCFNSLSLSPTSSTLAGVLLLLLVPLLLLLLLASTPSSHVQEETEAGMETRQGEGAVKAGRGEGTSYLFVYGTLKRGFHWSRKYLHQRTEAGTAAVAEGGERYARFVWPAISVSKHLLFVGDCGVPYLSLLSPSTPDTETETETGTQSQTGTEETEAAGHVVGELWEVSAECLRNLDDYEGTSKGYYQRTSLQVILPQRQEQEQESCVGQEGLGQHEVCAQVYHMTAPPATLLKAGATLVEHTHQRQRQSMESEGDKVVEGEEGNLEPLVEYTLDLHRARYRPVRHIRIKQRGYLGDRGASAWGHRLQPSAQSDDDTAM